MSATKIIEGVYGFTQIPNHPVYDRREPTQEERDRALKAKRIYEKQLLRLLGVTRDELTLAQAVLGFPARRGFDRKQGFGSLFPTDENFFDRDEIREWQAKVAMVGKFLNVEI